MNSRSVVAILVAVFAYRLTLLAGCAYLVGWQNWSPWWFLLALLLCGSVDTSPDHEK